MSIQTYYFKECQLLLTVATEELNDVLLKEHMLQFNEELAVVDEVRELADCRWITSIENFSIEGIIGALQVQQVRPNCKMALLVPESNALHYSIATTYKTFAKKKRSVEVFTCLNSAMSWLARDLKDKQQLEKTIIGFYNNFAWIRSSAEGCCKSKGIICM